MAHITVNEAQAWAQKSKLDLGTVLDGELEIQVSDQVLGRVASTYDISSWSDSATTPRQIKTIIAMFYVAWIYARTYSDDVDDLNAYAQKLMDMAEAMLVNILDGTTEIIGVEPTGDSGSPSFYPTDLSSASCPTTEDPSLGPAKFSMGTIF